MASEVSLIRDSYYDEVTDSYICNLPQKITLPEAIDGYTVSSLDCRAFSGCKNIKEVILPISLCRIGDYTFADCSNLVKATVYRGGDITFGKKVFARCASSITLSGISNSKVSTYANKNGYTFSGLKESIVDNNKTISVFHSRSAYVLVNSTIKNDKIINCKSGHYVDSYSNDSFLTISGSGYFKSGKTYKSKVTVTMASGLKAKYNIQIQGDSKYATAISPLADTITLSLSQRNGYPKQDYIRINSQPLGSWMSITKYKSENRKVVKVDKYGYLTATGKGDTDVTVVATNGKKKLKCTVKVIVTD